MKTKDLINQLWEEWEEEDGYIGVETFNAVILKLKEISKVIICPKCKKRIRG